MALAITTPVIPQHDQQSLTIHPVNIYIRLDNNLYLEMPTILHLSSTQANSHPYKILVAIPVTMKSFGFTRKKCKKKKSSLNTLIQYKTLEGVGTFSQKTNIYIIQHMNNEGKSRPRLTCPNQPPFPLVNCKSKLLFKIYFPLCTSKYTSPV